MKYLSVLLLIFPLWACSNSTTRSITNYETIAGNAARDTESARRLNGQAALALEAEEWEIAEKLLKLALAADVMFGPAHNNLGKAYFEQEKFYQAAWEFQNAVKLMPHQPEPKNNLGLVFEHTGRIDQAVGWYTQALENEPDNPELIGNLVRSRLRSGLRDLETKELLDKLVLTETRPLWQEWARKQQALFQIDSIQ